MVAAQGLDSVRPFFFPSGTRLFTLRAEVILQGKSPQAIIRYICWTYLSGYNLLKEAVTGHLLWRRSGEKCVSRCIVVWESLLAEDAGLWKCGNSGADVFKYDTLTFYAPFVLCPKDYFCPVLGINLILSTPSKIRFQPAQKAEPQNITRGV